MIVLLNIIVTAHLGDGARILGIVPTPSYSHHMVFKPLWRELSLRGHQVTTITTHPIGDARLINLTEIDLSHLGHDLRDYLATATKSVQPRISTRLTTYYGKMIEMIDEQLEYSPVKKLINDPSAKFDLVIAECIHGSMFAFARRFGCPSIGVLSMDGWDSMYRAIGNPRHSSVYPDPMLPLNRVTLFERVAIFIKSHVISHVVDRMQTLEQRIVEKHFGPGYPSVQQLSQEIGLLFINRDPTFHQVRPLVPAVVEIGAGAHRDPPKALPEDLQVALDRAENGFIYFSLGSNVQGSHLSPKLLNAFVEAFNELSLVVVWKFEGEEPPNLSADVIVSKWLPQQDVLRHRNIKLFITQGGLQSMDEGIYAHVPMIGIPFFGDQPHNVRKMVNKGFGLELDHRTLDKQKLKAAILEVVNNPKYRNTLIELAELAQDQPMTGIEKAVWWTEYVIRHKGAKHLRSPLLDIPWYQYLLLDVIVVLLFALLVILWVVYLIMRILVRSVLCKPSTSKKKNN